MSLYKQLFAGIYDPFVGSLEKSIYTYRKEILDQVHGDVLEVGAGTGINFQFYADDVHLLALEPSPFMLKRAKQKVPSGLDVTFLLHKINDAQLDDLIQENSLDFVVCTLVLCSIDDPRIALSRFHRWLKKDGKLIVLEHIHSEKKVNRNIQNIVNPLWKKVADGCNLNRDTDVLIKEMGFTVEMQKYFKKGLRFHSGMYRKE
jgi:ubiquinone/menaquinone biosynthesis C-methylase UbiE